MADPFAAPETPEAPAAPPPAPSISPEIEALIAQRVQALSDQRVAGLQSVFDKKLAEQQKEFNRLRRQVNGDPDEPDPDSDLAAQNAALQRQLAILQAAQKYPKAAPLYQQILAVEDTEEQIALMEQAIEAAARAAAPAAPAPTPAPQGDEVEVPDIDPNRPAPTQGQGFNYYDGVQMNDEIARQILGSVKNWPNIPA